MDTSIPETSRRSFLRVAGLAAGSLALSQALPAWRGISAALAGEVSADAFTSLVGQRFVSDRDGQRTELVLKAVEIGVDRDGAAAVGEHFSLIFTGPTPAVGDGGSLVQMDHPTAGSNTFFLAPVGGADQWQVVIDRRLPITS